MKKFFKIFVGFWALNLLVVVPLFFLLTTDVANRVDLEIRAKEPFSLSVYTASCEGERSRQLEHTVYCDQESLAKGRFHFYLAGRRDERELAFSFSEVASEVELRSIKISRRFVFDSVLDAEGIVSDCVGEGLEIANKSNGAVALSFTNGKGLLLQRLDKAGSWRVALLNTRVKLIGFCALEFVLFALSW